MEPLRWPLGETFFKIVIIFYILPILFPNIKEIEIFDYYTQNKIMQHYYSILNKYFFVKCSFIKLNDNTFLSYMSFFLEFLEVLALEHLTKLKKRKSMNISKEKLYSPILFLILLELVEHTYCLIQN